RASGAKVPVLTCYDYTTAKLMQAAGVPVLLVGDSAANVVLGHETTLPVSLDFMIEITAAVRRGAPLAMVMGDLPFGSYGGDASRGFDNATRMVKLSGCDCVKLEVGPVHARLVSDCANAGIAVVAHLGLRPQSVSLMGGYRFQGRTAAEARQAVELAEQMEGAGAAAILLEAVPPEVSQRIVERTTVPVIGCGAGPACHGSVIVTSDALGMNQKPPRFVPQLANIAEVMTEAYARYVHQVQSHEYPSSEHQYEMQPEEKWRFEQ
ncbi:MAG: 3-methyl-2-oxobutanoate hydroxymethyltransferase, partial [Phycisphaerae bacterium]|nr:3-methyl-2-oxobutanoate hydroxymethyltransferase [Phycisphaerae bacterium]